MTLPMDRTMGNTMGRNAIAVPPIARLAEGRELRVWARVQRIDAAVEAPLTLGR